MIIRVFLTIIAVIIPILFFGFLGCVKAPEHKADYGPEVSKEEVVSALKKQGAPDPLLIGKGEFSYYVYSQSVDIGTPKVVLQTGITVTNRCENDDFVKLDWVFERNDLIDGSFKSSKEEDNAVIRKKKSTEVEEEEEESTQKITYHHLSFEETEFPTPELVKSRSDCGGLKTESGQCVGFLKAMIVSYDRVVWENEKRGTKTHVQTITSPDVPYFSNKLQTCQQTWVDYQGRVVPVSLCKEIKDFKFGESSQTSEACQ